MNSLYPVLFSYLKISNEINYSNYNPYIENEKDFNHIVDIVNNIKPINNLNIEWRFSISNDKDKWNIFKETDLVFSDSEYIYDAMKRIWILNITHNENWNIYFQMDWWLLWVYGVEYSYYPLWWKKDRNIFSKNIILEINNNWLIYDPYRFD